VSTAKIGIRQVIPAIQQSRNGIVAALLRFPNDVIALFDCGFYTDYVEWLQTQGTEGRMDLPRPVKPLLNPGEIILRRGEKADALATPTKITTPAANHYQLMVEHFADAALNGAPLAYPPERVIRESRESSLTKTNRGWESPPPRYCPTACYSFTSRNSPSTVSAPPGPCSSPPGSPAGGGVPAPAC
jgi:hypothetical protein